MNQASSDLGNAVWISLMGAATVLALIAIFVPRIKSRGNRFILPLLACLGIVTVLTSHLARGPKSSVVITSEVTEQSEGAAPLASVCIDAEPGQVIIEADTDELSVEVKPPSLPSPPVPKIKSVGNGLGPLAGDGKVRRYGRRILAFSLLLVLAYLFVDARHRGRYIWLRRVTAAVAFVVVCLCFWRANSPM